MKQERLYEAIGAADDDLLARCEAPKKKKVPLLKWGTLAACAFLALISVAALLLSPPASNDQMPTLTAAKRDGWGGGSLGLWAYDHTELVNENPWTADMTFDTLPVYSNPLAYDDAFNVPGTDLAQMQAFLLDIAARLNLDLDSLHVTNDKLESGAKLLMYAGCKALEDALEEDFYVPTSVSAEQNGIEITVTNQMIATVEFLTPIPLPEQYDFSDHASYEDTVAAAAYLKEAYQGLIAMENPQTDVYGGDYNIYNEQSYHISFFQDGATPQEQLVNYHFHRIDFYGDAQGALWLIRLYQEDLSDKVGDYPIISVQEAQALLHDGYYIASAPPFTGEPVAVELVYRTERSAEFYMPYYRFLIEVDEDAGLSYGLKSYGAYYVPAVEHQYLSDMTLWDGRFNY